MIRTWVPPVVRAVVGVLAAALIAIVVVRDIETRNGPALTRGTNPASQSLPEELPQPVSAPGSEAEARAPGTHETPADTGGIDDLLESMADEAVQSTRPIEWHRAKFDGKAEFFSEADLIKAQRLVSRYFKNFEKIQSVRCTDTQTCTLREGSALEQEPEARDRVRAHNFALRVEATREPLFLRVTGSVGDRDQIDEAVTPAGKLLKGQAALGYSESFVPRYLDGETWFLEASLLKYGDRVRENVVMDVQVPERVVELHSRDLQNVSYDVVDDVKDDLKMTISYWFNRETGMLDFIITERQQPRKNEDRIFSVAVIDYAKVDETYYPKGAACYDYDFELEYREQITDLALQTRREVR